jgi:hypothetical protein
MNHIQCARFRPRDSSSVTCDRPGLSIHEALEVERFAHGFTPSTIIGTGLSAVPDSP